MHTLTQKQQIQASHKMFLLQCQVQWPINFLFIYLFLNNFKLDKMQSLGLVVFFFNKHMDIINWQVAACMYYSKSLVVALPPNTVAVEKRRAFTAAYIKERIFPFFYQCHWRLIMSNIFQDNDSTLGGADSLWYFAKASEKVI